MATISHWAEKKIPHHHAFKAHSDGDVLIHAICDALLGSLALGDIGQHFPDTAEAYQNIDSRILLRHVYSLVRGKSYRLSNLDCTIIAQSPKLMAHIESIRQNLANDLDTDISQISVKATTTERLGYTGREEGISSHAVVLIEHDERVD